MAPQDLDDLAAITGGCANALRRVGNFDSARQRQHESAEAYKKVGGSAVKVIGRELEALRIEILQGQLTQALPQVEARLAKVESWWQQRRAGQCVPEAPDPVFLACALIGALDIAKEAHVAQQDWESALRCIDASLEVKRDLGRSAEDIAATLGNRANMLGRLGRLGEAQAELETCLEVFQSSPADIAKVLSSLADLFARQGDLAQAIRQERRALAFFEQLPDPRGRAASHNNLAIHLERSGAPSALAEFSRHQLAALIYRLVAGLGRDLQTSLGKYGFDFRHAHTAGTLLVVPRVTELLADTAFRPLDDWLHQRQVDIDELQVNVDQFLERARQAALEQPPEPSP